MSDWAAANALWAEQQRQAAAAAQAQTQAAPAPAPTPAPQAQPKTNYADYWAGLSAAQGSGSAPQGPPQSTNPNFLPDPTGTGPLQGNQQAPDFGQPITTHYNNTLFATNDTAQRLATQLGGQVIAAPLREAGGGTPGSPFGVPDAGYIRMPNGAIVNAGTLQGYLDNYGPDAGMKMVQQEIAGDTTQGLANQGVDLSYWNNQFANNPTIPPQTAAPPPPSASAPPQARGGNGDLSGRGGVPTVGDRTGAGSPANGATTSPVFGRGARNPASSSSGSDLSVRGGNGDLSGRTGGIPAIGRTGISGTATPGLPAGRPVPPVQPPSGNPGTPTPPGGRPGPTPPTQPTLPTPPGSPPVTPPGGQPSFPGNPPYTPSGTVPAGANPAFPNWSTGDGTNGAYNGGDPGFMASAEANRAVDYGNTFENAYGNAYNQSTAQSQAYQGQSDAAYNWLNANPGYSDQETTDITQAPMLNGAMTTQGEYDGNQLTGTEQAAMRGDPSSVSRAFDPSRITSTAAQGNAWTQGQFEQSRQAARDALNSGQTAAQNTLGDYGTRLRATVDPSKLGISDQTVSGLKDQAGRQIGLQYGAAQDQMQRQAEAAGNVNPLALAASRERLLRSQSIDQADAVTNADLSAHEAQRQANVGIAGMQQSNENAIGQAGLSTDLSLTGLRTGTESAYGNLGASVGATANAQNIGATEAAGNTAINQASYVDQQNAARNAAIATNRQTTSQANQQQKYSQGYNTSNALSTRYKGVADQRIQGQQAARNYWQGQGQFQGSQANAASSSRIAGAQTSLSGMGQGASTAMGTEIGRRSTRPVSIGPGGITVGI